MNTEKLVAKGVEKKFDGQQLWFSAESLKQHYKGVKYHESDLDDSGFIKASDIFGDNIQEIEVEVIPEEEVEGFADAETIVVDSAEEEVTDVPAEPEIVVSEEVIVDAAPEAVEEVAPEVVVAKKTTAKKA